MKSNELAEKLPQPPFLRVHKSFIVSLDKIRMVDSNTIYIQDKGIPMGETYREQPYRLIREPGRTGAAVLQLCCGE